MKRAMIATLVLAFGSTGCVMASKYDALDKQFSETRRAMQGQLDTQESRIAELELQLAAEQKKVEQCEARIAGLKTDMTEAATRAEAEQQRLREELAALIKDRSRLKGSVEDMKQALAEANRRKEESERRISEYRQLVSRFQTLIDADKLRVKIVDGRMVVELATDVLFGSGSARLSKDGKEAIAEVAGVLATMNDRRFQVEGHTDNVPIRTERYPSNWDLAADRAITVVRTMVDAGMAADSISAASFAEFKPAAPNDTPEGRAANRRIEIVLLPDLSSLPGFDELNRMSGSRAP